jgi:cyclin B
MEKCNKMDIEDTPEREEENKNNSNFIPLDEEQENFKLKELNKRKLKDIKSSSELNCSSSTSHSNNASSMDKSMSSQNESSIYKNSSKIDIEKEKEKTLFNEEYLDEIYTNLIYDEKFCKLAINKDYMTRQKDINQRMRAILIDWIIEVHYCLNLKSKTLFQVVYIIDLYLSHKNIKRINLQLLGVASLLISFKSNEVYIPNLQHFIDTTGGAYTKSELLDMEKEILKTLNFEILFPTAEEFYSIISKFYHFTEVQNNLGYYFLDSSLIELDLLKYKPSTIGVACAYIVMKFFRLNGYKDLYSSKMVTENSPKKTIKECARELCFLVKSLSGSNLKSVKEKYSSAKYNNVASICDEK